jgi:SAM-dependent methyltransferase
VSTDRALLAQQYRDGSNLDARIALHARFSTATHNFHDWLFDFVVAPPDGRVLELGCGTGQLWGTVRMRIPQAWHIVLTDFSLGMLTGLRPKLAAFHIAAAFAQNDAQAIPFPAGYFDVVFANHMLYHVPDLPRALSEIRRVLKLGGQLIAATNGFAHMRELDSLASALGLDVSLTPDLPFKLESGAAQLAPFFASVVRHDFADSLAVIEVEPLVAYILSMRMAPNFFTPERVERLRNVIAERIAHAGVIHIAKSGGVFVCST